MSPFCLCALLPPAHSLTSLSPPLPPRRAEIVGSGQAKGGEKSKLTRPQAGPTWSRVARRGASSSQHFNLSFQHH